MRPHLPALLLASLPLLGVQAHAQPLQGAAAPSIVIERLDEEARQCGVSESMLDAAVRLPFASANLRINDNSTGTYVYINANVLRLSSGLCVANVSVELRRRVWLFPGGSQTALGTVWNKGVMLTGNASTFGRRVADETESFSKQLAAAWLKDN